MFNKIISKKIWQEIVNSKNILITFHPNPDGDSIGSSLALFQSLKNLKKNVTLISGDSQIPQNFLTVPGIDQVTKSTINNIDISEYDCLILPDISNIDQISKIEKIVLPKSIKIINIDHHVTNQGISKFHYIDETQSSTSQIIYNLLTSNNQKITPNIASSLFVGIYTDTGGFKYRGTDYHTFEIASKLTKIYPKFDQLIFDIENNDHPDRLKFLSLILNSIETHFNNNIAIASLNYQSIKQNNLNSTATSSSDIANLLKSITGWQIGVAIIENQPSQIKISFRTRDSSKFDLSKIATVLGGGGHKGAAGVTLKDISIDQAKNIILSKLDKVYKLGKLNND